MAKRDRTRVWRSPEGEESLVEARTRFIRAFNEEAKDALRELGGPVREAWRARETWDEGAQVVGAWASRWNVNVEFIHEAATNAMWSSGRSEIPSVDFELPLPPAPSGLSSSVPNPRHEQALSDMTEGYLSGAYGTGPEARAEFAKALSTPQAEVVDLTAWPVWRGLYVEPMAEILARVEAFLAAAEEAAVAAGLEQQSATLVGDALRHYRWLVWHQVHRQTYEQIAQRLVFKNDDLTVQAVAKGIRTAADRAGVPLRRAPHR